MGEGQGVNQNCLLEKVSITHMGSLCISLWLGTATGALQMRTHRFDI